MSNGTKRQYNSLTATQRYQLCQALDRDRELVPRYRRGDMAARYTEALGFPVSIHNISGAAEAVGVRFRHGGHAGGKRISRVKRLEAAVKTICRQLGVDYSALVREGVADA